MPAHISRRELLKWASAGAGAAVVGSATYAYGRQDPPSQTPSAILPTPSSADAPTPTTGSSTAAVQSSTTANADPAARLLVVVEMDGGSDGMSMLVPYGMGRYYDLRTSTAISEDDVLALDDQVGLHPSLVGVHDRGAAIVQGVGSFTPDESHFEMQARWWNGSPGASGVYDSGFLGRLADAIGDPAAAAVALSVGSGNHPAIASRTVNTLSLPGADSIDYLIGATDDDPFRQIFQRGYERFGRGAGRTDTETRLRAVKTQSLAFARSLQTMDDEDDGGDYPGNPLANGLRLAARLFSADLGVRIVHVPMQADFDTHDDHNGRFPGLMQTFDESVAAFFDDLGQRGLTDRVLLMTTSEFGRTAHDNDSGGLDHGTASNMMLMGPVRAGRYGEHPSLDTLDDNGNLQATVGFDQYYAGVAQGWFGVPASDVLDGNVQPIVDMFG